MDVVSIYISGSSNGGEVSSGSIQRESANCTRDTANSSHHGLDVLIVEHFLQSCDADLEHSISSLPVFSSWEMVAGLICF